VSLFPLVRKVFLQERPGTVRGAPYLGAAKRTLDGEDLSEVIRQEGKASEDSMNGWAAKIRRRPPLTPILQAKTADT